MKSFMQVVNEDVEYMENVNEGWLGAVKFLFPIAGHIAHAVFSAKYAHKLLNNPKFINWVKKAHAKRVAEEMKKNKNLGKTFSHDIPGGKMMNPIKVYGGLRHVLIDHCYGIKDLKPGAFLVCDTNSIQKLVFYLIDQTDNSFKYFTIPAPSKEDLE